MLNQADIAMAQTTVKEVKETRELETILETSQGITDRLGKIDERLGMISGRLSGEVPREVATEADDMPLTTGIIGQFKTTYSRIFRHCDSIEEWLTSVEKVI